MDLICRVINWGSISKREKVKEGLDDDLTSVNSVFAHICFYSFVIKKVIVFCFYNFIISLFSGLEQKSKIHIVKPMCIIFLISIIYV